MTGQKSTNITWHGSNVALEQRESALGQKGCVIWMTGLPGSGKSTVARRVEQLLLERGIFAYVLDGDNVRYGLNKDLGFSPGDRHENIRRIGEVATLFADAGVITMTAFISPYRADRDQSRAMVANGRFIEVLLDTPIELCEERDPKGLYKKARAGLIRDFTGVDAPYEEPLHPEISLKTACALDESAGVIIRYLEEQGIIN